MFAMVLSWAGQAVVVVIAVVTALPILNSYITGVIIPPSRISLSRCSWWYPNGSICEAFPESWKNGGARKTLFGLVVLLMVDVVRDLF